MSEANDNNDDVFLDDDLLSDDDGTSSSSTSTSTSTNLNNRNVLTILLGDLRKLDIGSIIPIPEIIDAELRDIHDLKIKFDEVARNLLARAGEDDSIESTRSNFNAEYRNIRNSLIQKKHDHLHDLKLPKLNIPEFDGDDKDWLNFRNVYVKNIHNNTKILPERKHSYLSTLLKGEALDLIKNLTISELNYEKAWNIILSHYNDPKKQLSTHLKSLNVHLPMDHKKITLKTLIGNYQQHYAALSSIIEENQNEPSFDPVSQILISIFIEKIPYQLRKDWEKESSNSKKFHTFGEFLNYMNQQADVSERALTSNHQPSSTAVAGGRRFIATVTDGTTPPPRTPYCQYCKMSTDHYIQKCKKFLDLPPEQRNTFIRKQRLCARCFRRKCNPQQCQRFKCKVCSLNHNTLIHCNVVTNRSQPIQMLSNAKPVIDIDEPSNKKNMDSYESVFPSIPSYVKILNVLGRPMVNPSENLLATITAYLPNGKKVKALLDSGSQFNFISESLLQYLKLDSVPTDHIIQTIEGTNTRSFSETNISVKSLYSSYKITLNCLVLKEIVNHLPNNYFPINQLGIPETLPLADPTFNIPSNIDLLIGSSIFWKILGNKKLTLKKIEFRDTYFGWIATGDINSQNSTNSNCTLVYNQNMEICKLLERFWDSEELPETKQFTEEEQACENIFLKTTTRLPDGRFIVHIPFRENYNTLGDSREEALKRFSLLERRFATNEKLRSTYADCLEEYITLGHMVEASDSSSTSGYFIPHHAVFKESSSTTKVRVVFDASMKSTSGLSLNDVNMVGPVVQSTLFSTSIRFRTYRYVFSTDITKMYRQIRVYEPHTEYQKIFWRKSSNDPLKVYLLQTVTFSVASSPYLATRCLKYLAEIEKVKYPKASAILMKDTYIDDILSGANTIEEALEAQKELTEVLENAGFPLNKWCANDNKLLESIPKEKCEKLREHGITSLGMNWHPIDDTLSVNLQTINIKPNPTKKEVLSQVSSIFDPSGIIGPITLKGKLYMKELWNVTIDDKKLNWNDVVPNEILSFWIQFVAELHLLKTLKIPRYNLIPGNVTMIELHGFADASEKAYGAVVYIRSINSEGYVSTKIVSSKSRVASLKKKSIPRLELCAALLLSELMYSVCEAFYNLRISTIRLWSDSTIALHWIHTQSYKLETYEANRVQKIQTLTRNCLWDHVGSRENPADLISRGSTVQDLLDSNLWWHGPNWLSDNNQPWPHIVNFIPSKVSSQQGFKKIHIVNLSAFISNSIFLRFSDSQKLIRVVAYIIRFQINAIYIGPKVQPTNKVLMQFEIKNSLHLLVKLAQKEMYLPEIRALEQQKPLPKESTLTQLNPFLDNQGLLRVGGRLQESNLSYDEKHPLIMDRHHVFTKNIIQHQHTKYLHANSQLLTSILRKQFWIPRIHTAVQSCIRNCVKCVRFTANTQEQIMANLPKNRVIPNKPFHITGVDYVGPIDLKREINNQVFIFKAYIILFVCFCTKAVHIELVANLSTQAFLNALTRFISRRGIPKEIHSDNGRSFVGAKPILDAKMKKFLKTNEEKIIEFSLKEGIDWHFIPPYSPHWGGLWESNIKAMKRHIRIVTRNCKYSYEEYSTLLCQIEAILNSRPLTYTFKK